MRKPTSKQPSAVLTGVSELNCDRATSRRMLKMFFVQREKDKAVERMKDLEKSVSINKEIIRELIENSSQEETSKKVLVALNKENAELRQKLQSATEESNSFQSRLLIAEQIIEDYKGKEETYEEHIKDQTDELLDQLNRKEFLIQSYERKLYTILDAVKKYAADTTIRKILLKLNVKLDKEKRITNVVEENATLASEVLTARARIAELESKLCEIVQLRNSDNSTKELSVNKKCSFNNSLGDSAQAIRLRGRVKELMDENELTKKALQDLQAKNERQSSELVQAKREIKTLKAEALRVMLEDKRPIAAIRDDSTGRAEISSNAEDSLRKEDIVELMSDD
eukprot:TRINITY_DN2912_c0_g3_i1.p1 TRINITY_DN2912_c0_g3~~TRINITY_DN2912_c0_g3_i1.p1  ORF type:complete len:340 (-),score=106.06 TRINITY_DN2912_c0_g3_i1:6-1025(-)